LVAALHLAIDGDGALAHGWALLPMARAVFLARGYRNLGKPYPFRQNVGKSCAVLPTWPGRLSIMHNCREIGAYLPDMHRRGACSQITHNNVDPLCTFVYICT